MFLRSILHRKFTTNLGLFPEELNVHRTACNKNREFCLFHLTIIQIILISRFNNRIIIEHTTRYRFSQHSLCFSLKKTTKSNRSKLWESQPFYSFFSELILRPKTHFYSLVGEKKNLSIDLFNICWVFRWLKRWLCRSKPFFFLCVVLIVEHTCIIVRQNENLAKFDLPQLNSPLKVGMKENPLARPP